MSLVLASNSPRRKQLLALGGWIFKVLPAEVDENPLPGESPRAYVLRLAEAKARCAAKRSGAEAIVIAADTTVVDGGDILGKPADARQAELMLRRLRGHTHQVYTALAVFTPSDGVLLTDCCVTDVPIREYSEEELRAYVSTGDPLDKAGAYAIQHPGFKPVISLQGCYANVVGMPLCHLVRTLDKLDIHPESSIPQACQASLQYACPVYPRVLAGDL
jgi:nucleoside triphosphate pyrophosphatase